MMDATDLDQNLRHNLWRSSVLLERSAEQFGLAPTKPDTNSPLN